MAHQPRTARTEARKAEPRRPRTRRQRRDNAAAASEPKVPAAEAVPPTAEEASRAPSKLDTVIALLRRPEGATLDQIVEATGWQRHSARGALAGGVKKKLGAAVVSEKADGVRRYKAPEVAR